MFPVVKGFSSVKPRAPRGKRSFLRETPCPPLVKGFYYVKPRVPRGERFLLRETPCPRGERSFLRAPVVKCFGSLVNHNRQPSRSDALSTIPRLHAESKSSPRRRSQPQHPIRRMHRDIRPSLVERDRATRGKTFQHK